MNIILIVALTLGACNKSAAPQEVMATSQVISSKNYVFNAQSVNPLGGKNIQLSGGYDLQISPTEIIATLPYFGRAFAPIIPGEGGITFTSKKFDYTTKQGTKGNWDIVIDPYDAPDVRELRLSVTADGYATLYVTSENRQAISYNGVVANKNSHR